MNKAFIEDYKRMSGNKKCSMLNMLLAILFRHQVLYMYLFRNYKVKNNIFQRILMLKLTKKYGLEISPKAEIGEGIYLGHPYNITVGSDVRIGKMVSLHKGCTIGQVNIGKNKGSPIIGDRVYIGINSTVVGNITIGNDVMIGANCFVNFDVPSHTVLINNGTVIRHKDHATEGYI